jgi:hypothetical protein
VTADTATPDAVVAEVPGTPDEQGWVRLHPLTPLLRGARFGVVLVFLLGQQGLRQESPYAASACSSSASRSPPRSPTCPGGRCATG